MTTRPTAELRRQVIERAGNCCEYCLLPENLMASTHQPVCRSAGGRLSEDCEQACHLLDVVRALLTGMSYTL
jgi:hypothetical protein